MAITVHRVTSCCITVRPWFFRRFRLFSRQNGPGTAWALQGARHPSGIGHWPGLGSLEFRWFVWGGDHDQIISHHITFVIYIYNIIMHIYIYRCVFTYSIFVVDTWIYVIFDLLMIYEDTWCATYRWVCIGYNPVTSQFTNPLPTL